jgi:hypothetical protein
MPEPVAPETGERPAMQTSRRVTGLVWAAIVAVDLAGLYFFVSRSLSNLYGDGIAHVEGARRISDSLTPGVRQIGSVWLPLFHLLAAPLALNNTLWRTGLAGSIISATAFALAAWLVFRLSSEMNRNIAAGVLALAVFLSCLSLLYLAATPMTELLAVFWALLVVYTLFRFQQTGRTTTVVVAAIAAFFGTFTRYDGWYLLPFAALFLWLCRLRPRRERAGQTLLFLLIAGAGPLLWFLYNAWRFHNPLLFYNGPDSAKGIYLYQLATTGFHYPTDGSLRISAHYYIEDLRLVLGPWSLILAVLGLVVWIVDREFRRRRAAALLLLVPLPFYIQSLAFASVALYVPTLFPHSYYNLRYGLEMAPAIAVCASFLLSPRLASARRRVVLGVLLAILAGQWVATAWGGARNIPIVREAVLNTPCKSRAEQDVIGFLDRHYDGGNLLLAAGEWICVMPRVGIAYRDTLTEMNHEEWHQLHHGAARYVKWIIAERGDAVNQLMNADPKAFAGFDLMANDPLPGSRWVAIYRRRSAAGSLQSEDAK